MAAELKSGSMLGRYELLARLGRGGMASVWVARERAPVSGKQRLVAVKAMLPELARHSDFRAMFLEEGQIVRSIDHPHVVKVHEVSEDHGILYMAMDWVEGDSLRSLIKEARRRRPIPAEIAVKIIADAAAGLHAAHELRGWDGELRNVVHCDVSPHNILIGLDGLAKLVDFGVANAAAHSDLGSEERIKGKFGYMSPEQASAEKLDRRSDVFALGIVLYELVTGERLFKGENAAHVLELVRKAEVPDPTRFNPRLSPRLVAIVLKALARERRERFQTAAELGEALERFLVEERVMVSHASVGHLVRRVLGARIELQRQALREALTASDGLLEAGLVPDRPAAPDRSHPSSSGGMRFAGTPSDPPTASSMSKSSTPHPQSLEIIRPRPMGVMPALSALVGVSAAAASIWYVNSEAPRTLPATGLPAVVSERTQAARPAARPVTATVEANQGVSIDSLPLAALPAAAVGNAHPSMARPASSDSPSFAASAKSPEAAAPPTQDPNSEELPTPELEAPVPAPERLPPPDERTPLNRAAALTALSNAATSAASCRRSGGPSGTGSVSVTFSPDGPVSAVNVAAPFTGTPTGSCVATVFRSVRVPPFSGSAVTLTKSFRIPE